MTGTAAPPDRNVRLVATAGTLLAALVLTGCSGLLAQPNELAATTAPASTSTALASADATPPDTPTITLIRGICVDPSSSTRATFSKDVVTQLAEQVRAWVPADDQLEDGLVATPGLSLTLRLVGTDSYSTDAVFLSITVPAARGLAPRPDLTADGVLDPGGPYEQWTAEKARALDERQRATAAAKAGANRLATLALDHTGMSGITGCLSALAQTLPSGHDRRILLASDLADNRPAEITGNFAGAPVLILQPCPSGDAGTCSALVTKMRTVLRALHAGPLTVVRSENAGSALKTWMAPR